MVQLAVSNKAVLCIGTILNLLVISAPLAFVDILLLEYLCRPVTWVYYSLVAVFCFLESRDSLNLCDGNPVKTEKAFLPYLIGICVLIFFWIAIYDYANYFSFYLIQAVIGSLIVVMGVSLRLISIRKLNQYFLSHVALVDNHQLITTGIYSFVRHPSELGLLTICFGVAILLSSMTGLWFIALVLCPLTIYRISLEERLLRSLFTTEYEKYRTTTPRLLPEASFNHLFY